MNKIIHYAPYPAESPKAIQLPTSCGHWKLIKQITHFKPEVTCDICRIQMSQDMLHRIFEKQKQLQRKLGTYPKPFNEQYIKDMTLAAIVELTEILNETPWKPWKKNQELNSQRYKEEIADLMHFVINLCIVARIEPDELYRLYMDKNKVNIERKQGGY